MRGRLEATEATLQQLESQTEQIEQRMEEIENAIEQIEASISRLEGKGDHEVAASLQHSLAQRRQEKEQEKHHAQQVAQELEHARSEIREVDKWNNDAHREIAKLEQLGENVGDAANRIADRERWVEEQDAQCRDLQKRLSQLSGGGGFG